MNLNRMIINKFIKILPCIVLAALPYWAIAQLPTVYVNTGNVNVNTSGVMYVNGSVEEKGDNALTQLDGRILITGDFINNVTQNNVFVAASTGRFTFTGDVLQTITGNALRDVNYIAFPNVTVIKTGGSYVKLDVKMAADMKELYLQTGKLQLPSTNITDNKDATTYNSIIPYRTAHLRLAKFIRFAGALPAEEQTMVEMQMALAPNSIDRVNRIYGFSPPFSNIYADYFYNNYIAMPDATGLWNNFQDTHTSEKDLNAVLINGVGYILGQNILPDNPTRYTLDPAWGNPTVLKTATVTDMLTLNRYNLDATNSPLAGIVTQPNRYNVETISANDITVSLNKGWNFIGNPFTAPLDLSLLISTAANSTVDEWKVARLWTGAANSIIPRYYVLAGGTGALDNWTPDKFTLNPVWLSGSRFNSTIALELDDAFVIEPMQTIALYANSAVKITIPASKRTHGLSKAYDPGNGVMVMPDEMLIQVANDVTTGLPHNFDRTVLSFMAGTSAAVEQVDVVKTVDSLASPGQIFTQSSDGFAMIGNLLDPNVTKAVEMGMIPTLTEQAMVLTSHRVKTSVAITQVWLEDRIKGGAWINLKTAGAEYKFTSKPGDRIDRFVIHLNVAQNSQTITPKPLPETLFKYDVTPAGANTQPGIHAATQIAQSSTGPVGSRSTNIQVDITTNEFCEDANASVNINPSALYVDYKVYDKYKGGNLKGSATGNGGLLNINVGAYNKTSPNVYYAEAPSNGTVPAAIRRLLPVTFDEMIFKIKYPDIRINVCPTDQTINLSKYLDTVSFLSVEWSRVAGNGTLSGSMLQLHSSGFGTETYEYKVTNKCETATPAKLYVTHINKEYTLPFDTIKICYEVADVIYLNQIFGIELQGGQIIPETPGLSPAYFKVSKAPQEFAGAVMFLGKQAYLQNGLLPLAPSRYGADAKEAVFKFIPPNGSCFNKSEYSLVIVLTKE